MGHAMTDNPMLSPVEFAHRVCEIIGFKPPVAASKVNGWFGGYGCRWCAASRAWFTVVPFEAASVAELVANLFREAGLLDVTISNEGGVSQADNGRGLQVSAYV